MALGLSFAEECFCELTIDNEQLTIVVSFRDEFEYFCLEHTKNPRVLPDYRIFSFFPEEDSFIVNYPLSIVNSAISLFPRSDPTASILFCGCGALWLCMFFCERMQIYTYSSVIYAICEKISIFLKIPFIFPLTIDAFGCIVNQNSLHRWSTKVRTEKTKGRK